MNRRARIVRRLVAPSRLRKSRRRYISRGGYADGGPVVSFYDPPAPPTTLADMIRAGMVNAPLR